MTDAVFAVSRCGLSKIPDRSDKRHDEYDTLPDPLLQLRKTLLHGFKTLYQ